MQAFASDTFQARKTLLVGSSLIAVIGCGIAPGSTNIYRLIVAQILIGCGFASVPLAYAIPSEIVPRKWRPRTYYGAYPSGARMLTVCVSGTVFHKHRSHPWSRLGAADPRLPGIAKRAYGVEAFLLDPIRTVGRMRSLHPRWVSSTTTPYQAGSPYILAEDWQP